MNAAISPRLGIAWLVEKNQSWSFSLDQPEWVLRRPDEERFFFAGASDVEYLNVATREEISDFLNVQVDCLDAFDCVLFLLDGELSRETRQEAASELHDLLENRKVLQDLESLYFSYPLPDSADYDGALQAIRMVSSERAHSFLLQLGELQSWIRRCKDAWEKVGSELFAPGEQDLAEAILLRAGIHRELVTALFNGESLAPLSLSAIQVLQKRNIKNYRNIVASWLSDLARKPAQGRAVLEPEQFDPEDKIEPRKKESGRRRHNQNRRLPMPGGGVFELVKVELAQIRENMKLLRMDLAWPEIEKLISLQLTTESGKEFACKSLCNLDDFAKEIDWESIREKLTSRALELNPKDPFARTQRADVMHGQGNLDGALLLFDSTLEDFPKNKVACCGKAGVLKSMGRLQEAFELYDSTIEKPVHDPVEDMVARNGKAEVLKAMGRLEEALATYESTLRDYPNEVIACSGKAEVLKAMGRLEEALTLYDSIGKDFRQDVVACCGKADVLELMGRFGEALTLYESIICEYPENRVARCGKAEVLKSMGKLEEALATYDSTIQIFPHSAVARCGKASVLSKLKKYDSALACIEQIPVQSRSWVAFHMQAMLFLKVGRHDEGLRELRRGAAECPFVEQRDYFVTSLAMIELHNGKVREAENRLEAVKSFRLQAGRSVLQAHCLAQRDDSTRARSLLDTIAAISPIVEEAAAELRHCLDNVPFVPSRLLMEQEFHMLLAA